jgi:hypothetical protein
MRAQQNIAATIAGRRYRCGGFRSSKRLRFEVVGCVRIAVREQLPCPGCLVDEREIGSSDECDLLGRRPGMGAEGQRKVSSRGQASISGHAASDGDRTLGEGRFFLP